MLREAAKKSFFLRGLATKGGGVKGRATEKITFFRPIKMSLAAQLAGGGGGEVFNSEFSFKSYVPKRGTAKGQSPQTFL